MIKGWGLISLAFFIVSAKSEKGTFKSVVT